MKINRITQALLVSPLVFECLGAALLAPGPIVLHAEEYLPGIEWAEPQAVRPGFQDAAPPSDAVVLFDGKDLSAWKYAESWTVSNGVALVGKKNIETRQKFGDCQLHLEWRIPADASNAIGQDRGNSGILFMPHRSHQTGKWGKYELQILDSYESKTYPDGQAGAIYKQMPPMVNAMRPPGKWNTYDVVFISPKFGENGVLREPARITLFQNGVLVQHDFRLFGPTSWNEIPTYSAHDTRLPIGLQSKGQPVQFRNIWVREIQFPKATRVSPPMYLERTTGETRPINGAKEEPHD